MANEHFGKPWVRWLTFGHDGMTINNHIWYASDNPSRQLRKHEQKHVEQYGRWGTVGFLAMYSWDWVRFGFNYKKIRAEREARRAEHD